MRVPIPRILIPLASVILAHLSKQSHASLSLLFSVKDSSQLLERVKVEVEGAEGAEGMEGEEGVED